MAKAPTPSNLQTVVSVLGLLGGPAALAFIVNKVFAPDDKVIEVAREEYIKSGAAITEPSYRGLFPKRQLWTPKLEYPLWDNDWDGKRKPIAKTRQIDTEKLKFINKHGITRHIILVRHGQYEQTPEDDSEQVLTELGRKQAELTGQRLAQMCNGSEGLFESNKIRVLRVSDMARAKETAEIIAKYLPEVKRADPDPLLNEGFPAQVLPLRHDLGVNMVQEVDDCHDRIEEAFHKYMYRANLAEDIARLACDNNFDDAKPQHDKLKAKDQHEFEVIVCHGNLIRYFFCRALQLPPEAWLRMSTFNCSLTYLMIKPTGDVTCRMLGDIGHLGPEHSTFSMKHGFAWS